LFRLFLHRFPEDSRDVAILLKGIIKFNLLDNNFEKAKLTIFRKGESTISNTTLMIESIAFSKLLFKQIEYGNAFQ